MATFRCEEHGVTMQVNEFEAEVKGKKQKREARKIMTEHPNFTACDLPSMPSIHPRSKGDHYKDSHNRTAICRCEIKEV